MRFSEFGDRKPYTVPVSDTDEFPEQPKEIQPKNDAGTKIPRKVICNSHGVDTIIRRSHRRRPSVPRLQPRR